jgi:serine/threonine protein kinase
MLPLGTHLLDYEITGLIGEGGFGIVYLAWDHSLQRKVAIKEYMPASMASRIAGSSAIVVKSERHLDTFKAGLKSFMNEARLLARFDHPALVKVYRFWEENGTAYMAMPFYEGRRSSGARRLGHAPSEAQLRAWLRRCSTR